MVWLHNDKEIKPSKDFEYDSAGDMYTLKIAEIFPEDSGCYTCEAFNDAGESFSSCTLVVLGERGVELASTVLWPVVEASAEGVVYRQMSAVACIRWLGGQWRPINV